MNSNITRSAALTTAGCLIGGIAAAIAVGAGIDGLLSRHSLILGRGLAAAVALAIFASSARLWGRRMSRLSGVGNPGRTGKQTAIFVGIPLIAMASGLAPLEPVAVRIVGGHGLPIHAPYVALFVPAALIVAALGSFGLGRGLESNRLGLQLASIAAPAAAVAFLLVAAFMYVIGWRVGAPDAGRRATMLVVTAVSATAAALVAGASIGRTLGASERTAVSL